MTLRATLGDVDEALTTVLVGAVDLIPVAKTLRQAPHINIIHAGDGPYV